MGLEHSSLAQPASASGPAGTAVAAERQRYVDLEARVRCWPRNADNDPFHVASLELARDLEQVVRCPVLVGFNEFCAPSLDEALQRAITDGAEKVIVVTPMMTRGGEHAEADIPAAIHRAQERHPDVRIQYAWPFDSGDVARFLAEQIARRTENGPSSTKGQLN